MPSRKMRLSSMSSIRILGILSFSIDKRGKSQINDPGYDGNHCKYIIHLLKSQRLAKNFQNGYWIGHSSYEQPPRHFIENFNFVIVIFLIPPPYAKEEIFTVEKQ